MAVIFLFIDGVGLGETSASNPFYANKFPGFSVLCENHSMTMGAESINREDHLFKPLDACLDVKGLPQSGTGQAALFSGENAAEEVGRHFGPFPHSGIKHLLEEQSLFHKAGMLNKTCHFINAYPDIFFKKAQKRDRWSCTTLMTRSANIPLNTTEDVIKERAITAGITQKAWREHLNLDVPEITPEAAAERLLKKSSGYDLLLHEYYLSDKAGHSRDMQNAEHVLSVYDRFLWHLIKNKDEDINLVLTSDHGNVEDLSTKTHTLNPVPLFVLGPGSKIFSTAESITDVTPCILKLLNNNY